MQKTRMRKLQNLAIKFPFHSSSLFCIVRSSSRSSQYRGLFNELKPPIPRKEPVAVSAHGITWHDPYQWMSNAQDPAVSQHLEQENHYTEAFMKDTAQLQRQLEAEMLSRMAPEFSTPPERWGPWLYYQRIPEGKEFPMLCRRRERRNGYAAAFFDYVRGNYREEVLLDWNEVAVQFGYVNVGTYRISPDQRYLAYTLDVSRRELFTLFVKDLRTGSILSNTNIGVVNLAWSKNGQILLYTVGDDLQRPSKVLGKRLDSEYEDMLLFEEKDTSCCVDIASTKDCQFITINSNSRTSSEVYLMDSADITTGIQRIRKRETGVQYFVEHHHGFFYILTNAPLGDNKMVMDNYYVAKCSVGKIGSNEWQDGKQLEDLNSWFLPMPADTSVVIPGSNDDFNSSIFRAVISSPLMPEATIDYDLSRRQLTLVQQVEVLGVSRNTGKSQFFMNHSASPQSTEVPEILSIKAYRENERGQLWSDFAEIYCCERREVLSHDAVRIPLTIIHSRKVKQDGTNAGIVHGYGAYGETLDKRWCSDLMSLLDRGFIIAYADVRGGGGGGKSWHNAGKALQKTNSIFDFIACSKYLVEEGYVHKKYLGAMGISAGGLLVASSVNTCPDLYGAIILKVPFLDVCNTLLDPSLPLTVLDYEEFGDPRSFVEFSTIRSYSPYENIQKGVSYPAMLVTASFHDSRVGFWEAAKWVARVRELTERDYSRPVLLKTNMNTGHFGESGRYRHCKETAFEYAFFLKMLGP
ncbi:uncharacterized protein LOC131076988 isoform X2 [Cryptomeria japonica]|uniref:uncharacterized protein LOC131076988 isoform X2 n=1 Tax=Cryptomeria japonica TaxID=3369 RepID=UPI0027DA8EAE|nr:uncharacterized protein LOC131076988 isoform X2 [Cryptomeria japonica]